MQCLQGRPLIQCLSVQHSVRVFQIFMLELTYTVFSVLTRYIVLGDSQRYEGTLGTAHTRARYLNPQIEFVSQNLVCYLLNL